MNRCLFSLAMVLTCMTAQAQKLSDQDINLMMASAKTVKLLTERGMVGVFDGVNTCYTKLLNGKKPPAREIEFCIAMDMSAVFADYSVATANGYPRDQRFIDEVASSRMHILLERVGASHGVRDTQKYLSSRHAKIERFTASAMRIAAQSPEFQE